MIRYDLICKHDHAFEGWFSSSSDYDDQRAKRLIQCPICSSAKIEKAIMAPNVATSRKKDATAQKQLAMMNEFAAKIREEISTKCDDVGDKFADEARAIHYGEKPERGIYGQATKREAEALHEEGIAALPLPDMLAPTPAKKKLN
ncbi:DUF1178 family protein [Litorimonas sp. RW-G-Af-16]|uniref:DUF1178 family protein n=1 Tax=Litorimonas sp. RW-G-Af-16 TaxID=3241168 RepID=UPI00390C4B14